MTWCWWCVHPFEGEQLALPYKYDELRNRFSTTGCFCSWSCMKAYAIDKYGITRGGVISSNIIIMRKRMYNKIGRVRPAPWRYHLKVFGGDMTIEEFREGAAKDVEPPKKIDTVSASIATTDDLSQPNKFRMEEIKKSDVPNQPLKLKRPKPLKTTHNDLESALGLIIETKPKQLSHDTEVSRHT